MLAIQAKSNGKCGTLQSCVWTSCPPGGRGRGHARTAFVADLRPDARQPRQAGHAVRTGRLAVIKQIIVQLAVAIDLAACVPGLPDQFGLPSIFTSPLTQRTLLPSIVERLMRQ